MSTASSPTASPAASSSSPASWAAADGRSTLRAEQVRRGERPWPAAPEQADALRAHIAALDDDDARTLSRLSPAAFAARVVAASSSSSSSSSSWTARAWRGGWGVPAALAAAAMVVVAVGLRAPVESEGDRAKGTGGPALVVHHLVDGHARPLRSGDVVSAGAVVQVQTRAGGYPHGVVVSVDGAGAVTRHFPEPGAATTLPAGTAALPFSFELDDAPDFERFFLVVAPHPLDPAAIVAAARATADAGTLDARTRTPLRLPADAVAADFLLRKR
jgi:hypothetical protein